MKSWILSLAGAVALSFGHLLLDMWHAFMDFAYIFPDYGEPRPAASGLNALARAAIFGAWLASLASACLGKRARIVGAPAVAAFAPAGLDTVAIISCPKRGVCS